ncbi:MAG: hypothetical protein ACREIT_01880 [Tepidisphaeraceae bacterium]
MASESHGGTSVLHGINWKQAFPFTNLFRSFRIAIHPSKLLLALALLCLLYVGGRILDAVWPEKNLPEKGARIEGTSVGSLPGLIRREPASVDMSGLSPQEREIALAMQEMAEAAPWLTAARDRSARDDASTNASGPRQGIFITFFDHQVRQINNVADGVLAWHWLGTGGILDSICNFFVRGPVWLFRNHCVFAILFTLWFLLLWSIFGGAIARIAAVHVARDEKISVRQALKFSLSKVLSFLFAPIIPLLIVLAVGIVVTAGALLNNIPWLGPIVVGALFFLALAAGFVMTLVLIGLVGGFNLMYPTIAVEGSDSFDAISRSFSYLYARPWRLLFYTAVAIVYGALTYLFIKLFIFLMLLLTHEFVDFGTFARVDREGAVKVDVAPGATDQRPEVWNSQWPHPVWPNAVVQDTEWQNLNGGERIGAFLVKFWVYLTLGMLGAYAISYYFSANTIIYYLMRHEVDATELDDVYVEQSDEDFGETAPVGAPATTPPAGETIVTQTTITTVEPGPVSGSAGTGTDAPAPTSNNEPPPPAPSA